MSKRRGRRTKRKKPVALIVSLVIICLVAAGVITLVSIRNKGSTEMVDLNNYYKLMAHVVTTEEGESTEYADAGEDELAIVLNDEILDERAVLSDGMAYLPYRVAKNSIDTRFYHDTVNNIIVVTNAAQKITSEVGQSGFAIDGEAFSTEKPVSMLKDDTLYISTEFIDRFSSAESKVGEEPRRVYVETVTGKITTGAVNSNTQIREGRGVKSDIVSNVEAGSKVIVSETEDGWSKVVTDSGLIGFVQEGKISGVQEEERVSSYEEPEYTHVLMDGKVNMAWYGVYYWEQDADVATQMANVTGINVVSPRWYSLNDTEGNLDIYSNADFINYAHERGFKVWAMIDDVDTEFVVPVLRDSNKRDHVIDTIMEDALREGVDGLNLDFEHIIYDVGDDYIQFIRELSIKCRQGGIVFSVDNYTPYSYNAFFHVDQQMQCADYVAIMAYDHYLGTDIQGPNSSVDFLQEVMDVTLPQVEENRLIIALPFYSRMYFTDPEANVTSEESGMAETKAAIEERGGSWAWDDATGMNLASFDYEGGHVTCWIEDVDSVRAKLNFLKDYNIAGVSWWRIGQQTDDVWAVISEYY